MSSELDFLPIIYVKPLRGKTHTILCIWITVFPSIKIEPNTQLLLSDTIYPSLHFTLQYRFESADDYPKHYFLLPSPSGKRRCWTLSFKHNIIINPKQQLLRVGFWLPILEGWQCIACTDWVIPPWQSVSLVGGPFLSRNTRLIISSLNLRTKSKRKSLISAMMSAKMEQRSRKEKWKGRDRYFPYLKAGRSGWVDSGWSFLQCIDSPIARI